MHFLNGNYITFPVISSLASSNHLVHVAVIIVSNRPPEPATKNQSRYPVNDSLLFYYTITDARNIVIRVKTVLSFVGNIKSTLRAYEMAHVVVAFSSFYASAWSRLI